MILTVTLNPLLERRFTCTELNIGSENRSKSELLSAGGKGINVSRQLNHLNTKNLAFTFLGGNNGKILKNILLEEKINFSFIQTKSETREASLIIEESSNRLTTVFGPNSQIIISEADEFKSKLSKMIENCEIVVFSGSSPCRETNDIFPFGIETANEFGKISICDTYGEHYKNCIEKAPTIIHNNTIEIYNSFDLDISDKKNKIEFLDYLYSKGVKQSFITNGSEPVYAGNFDFIYKAEIPSITALDATGSGDAFVAGIAYGLHNSFAFEESFKTALSLGTANAASLKICQVKPDEINRYSSMIEIQSIGKKMVDG